MVVEERGGQTGGSAICKPMKISTPFPDSVYKFLFTTCTANAPYRTDNQIISPSPHQAVDSAVSFDVIALP
jgi:hypothetical protein